MCFFFSFFASALLFQLLFSLLNEINIKGFFLNCFEDKFGSLTNQTTASQPANRSTRPSAEGTKNKLTTLNLNITCNGIIMILGFLFCFFFSLQILQIDTTGPRDKNLAGGRTNVASLPVIDKRNTCRNPAPFNVANSV